MTWWGSVRWICPLCNKCLSCQQRRNYTWQEMHFVPVGTDKLEYVPGIPGYDKCHIQAPGSGDCKKYFYTSRQFQFSDTSFLTLSSWPKYLRSQITWSVPKCLFFVFFPNIYAAQVTHTLHFILPQLQHLRAVWVMLVLMCQSSAWKQYFFPFCPTDTSIRVKPPVLNYQEERNKGKIPSCTNSAGSKFTTL